MAGHEELGEHIEHARDPFDKTVAGSMAMIAACLAVVTVLGQHYNTEKLLTQQQASDQWAFYQAKDIRRYMAQVAGDVLLQQKADAAVSKRYSSDANKYRDQTAEIQNKAREFERERDKMGHEADSFHIGEVFLEISIVLSSLAILFKRPALFYGGALSATAGLIVAISGYVLYGVLGRG